VRQAFITRQVRSAIPKKLTVPASNTVSFLSLSTRWKQPQSGLGKAVVAYRRCGCREFQA
jgi:hypothetical protein